MSAAHIADGHDGPAVSVSGTELLGELAAQPRDRLLVLHVITGLGDGGAEGALYRLCKFDEVNRHVVVSLMDGGKHQAPLERLGVPVHCLHMRRGRATLGALWRLRGVIRSYRPDVVQTWLYHADLIGGLAARVAGVSRVIWGIRHATLAPGTVKPGTIAVVRLSSWLSHWLPDRIVCCSEAAAHVHIALGYDRTKIVVIPNGYDLSALTPDPAKRAAFRRELGIPGDLPLLGMVARFDPAKDHRNLLKALARLAASGLAFKCALVGTGMDADNATLAGMIAERGLGERMILLGRRDDIATVMNGLDLHVLSSVSEAFPNAIAEAMACGTPSVGTDVGDTQLILGDTGWLARPSDPAALASAIQAAVAALGHKHEWQRRQAAARAHVGRRFAIEAVVRAYGSCWRDTKPIETSPRRGQPTAG